MNERFKWICLVFILFNLRGVAFSSEYFLMMLNVKARPIAMGGAFGSLKDDLASLDMNPASFSLSSTRQNIHFITFINPAGPLYLLNRESGRSWDVLPGMFIHGMALSIGNFNLGVIIGQEIFSRNSNSAVIGTFKVSDYKERRNATFGLSLSLSPLVSLGMAGDIYMGYDRMVSVGYRYGILIETKHRINAGLYFVDFPDDYSGDRFTIERLEDETLNIGVSYNPFDRLTLSLDIRNVSDEGRPAVREPHIGFEFIPYHHVALRGGYFRSSDGKSELVSFGFGFLDWNYFVGDEKRFPHKNFGLNLSAAFGRIGGIYSRWIFLSAVFRLST